MAVFVDLYLVLLAAFKFSRMHVKLTKILQLYTCTIRFECCYFPFGCLYFVLLAVGKVH